MSVRKTLIAANWKMNGDRLLAESLLSSIFSSLEDGSINESVEILVCPSFTLLADFVNQQNQKVMVGAQNISQYESGAYTGEISAEMLKAMSCEYVLIGHSERREIFAETNEILADKFVNSARQGLKPVLCIGETHEQRESAQTEAVLEDQLSSVIEKSNSDDWQHAVIAYEPVWAIGTGKTATAEMAQTTHKFIRQYLKQNSVTAEIAEQTRILYGGSMKPENAFELLAQEDIDGGLIGGASLKPDSFVSILQAAG